MTDYTEWKLKFDGSPVAQILQCVKSLEGNVIRTKALDGTIYMQTIGKELTKVALTVFCTREEMHVVNRCEAQGFPVEVVYRDSKYTGYIGEVPSWSAIQPGKNYQGTINVWVESEVALG